jgi:hypothetical protein
MVNLHSFLQTYIMENILNIDFYNGKYFIKHSISWFIMENIIPQLYSGKYFNKMSL